MEFSDIRCKSICPGVALSCSVISIIITVIADNSEMSSLLCSLFNNAAAHISFPYTSQRVNNSVFKLNELLLIDKSDDYRQSENNINNCCCKHCSCHSQNILYVLFEQMFFTATIIAGFLYLSRQMFDKNRFSSPYKRTLLYFF